MKVLVVGGIRPDFINLSVLLEEMKRQRVKSVFVNTGQHYSYNLSKIFFNELGLPSPDYNLNMPDGLDQGKQMGFVFSKIGDVLKKENPDIVVSFSDANPATFAIVAAKMGYKVAHLEAGMRSMDRRMPEEINRRAVDAISDLYFCPTEEASNNLLLENVAPKKIKVVGKLLIDVLKKFEPKIKIEEQEVIENHGEGSYIFSTIHRPENTESRSNLQNILKSLELAAKKYERPVVASFHPRTTQAMSRFGLKASKDVFIRGPMGMFEFVAYERNAYCYIGDSGTCQEETTYYGVPSVITRASTERWETVNEGTSELGGNKDGTIKAETVLKQLSKAIKKVETGNWTNPYKPGASKKIVSALKKKQDWIKKKKVMWND